MEKLAKLKIGLAFIALISFTSMSSAVFAQGGLEGPGGDCKWKRASCGLFQGTYEACLTNGDGSLCSCGDVTRNC
ncbi:hypothetical protein [Algoriphagus formosus]|jgi:hypothetical protein|uniref:Uncharacterized protein n=2 Tax=Algoriphagus formosus TaxID=2007308 RepID=A0A4R5V821_9BACT|nr:hypothetical protein [Algoriphagus aquimaris]TDK48011.1 hypothetical protein E1898_04880 [Algoriphagus aquimaris]